MGGSRPHKFRVDIRRTKSSRLGLHSFMGVGPAGLVENRIHVIEITRHGASDTSILLIIRDQELIRFWSLLRGALHS